MGQAIERSVEPLPFYYHILAIGHMMNEEWERMFDAASKSVVNGSSVGHGLLAVAYEGMGNREAAGVHLERMGAGWPMLASDPAKALKAQHIDPGISAAFIEGLERAGWAPVAQ